MTGGAAGTKTFTSAGRAIGVERFDGGPASGGPRPGVLLLHGADGLSYGAQYRMAAGLIATAGYHVFLVHYLDRTGETRAGFSTVGQRFPIWAETVRHALDFIGTEPGVDPSRLGIVGVSLGGALGIAVAAEDARVRALVEYFGFVPEGVMGRAARLPPTLILHGAWDAIVPASNAYVLQQMLERSGIVHEIAVYPDQAHGFHGAAEIDAGRRTAAFLARHLVGSEQTAEPVPAPAG